MTLPDGMPALRSRVAVTNREQQVVALVCQGLSNKQIAHELRLSEGTVKIHVHHILTKNGLRSRMEIVAAANGRLMKRLTRVPPYILKTVD